MPQDKAFLTLTLLAITALPATASPLQDRTEIASKVSEEKKADLIKKEALKALHPLLDDLLHVDNVSTRVKLAEPIIAMLWSSDADACRKLLNILLDDCVRLRGESAGKENSGDPDRLARKVIQIAAKLDAKFAKKLLERYQEALKQETDAHSNVSGRTKFNLALASQLLDQNAQLAVQIAETAIRQPVTPETLRFLMLLRGKDAFKANRLFSVALAGVHSRYGMDPNEFLLLFSYVFSPRQIPFVTERGLAIYKLPDFDSLPDNATEPALAQQYLDSVAQLLLAPERYSTPGVQPAFGLAGDWFVIKIIEPQVHRYRPPLVDSLFAQRSLLEAKMRGGPSQDAAAVERWRDSSEQRPSAGANDTVDALLKRANQTGNSKQRDQLFYRAAMAAARAGEYERAIAIADDLSIDSRTPAKEYLNFEIATAAIGKGDIDKAVRIAEKDSDLLRRAYVFTQVAKALIEKRTTDLEQVRFYLSAGEALVSRLENDEERISAVAGLIQVYSQIDPAEGFKLLPAMILYANKAKTFSGELAVSRMLEIGGFYFDYSLYQDPTIEAILRPLARWDFAKTLEAAREFNNPSARIRATVAISKSVLTKPDA